MAGNRWENDGGDGGGGGDDVGNPRRGALNTEGGGGSGNRRRHHTTDEPNRTCPYTRMRNLAAVLPLHPRASSSSSRSFRRSLVARGRANEHDDGSAIISPFSLLLLFSFPVVQRSKEPRVSNVVPPPALPNNANRETQTRVRAECYFTVSPLHTLPLSTHTYTRLASGERERERDGERRRKSVGLPTVKTLPRPLLLLLLR